MKFLTITDSLGEEAGGLAHASLNLACAAALGSPSDEFYILCGTDKNEIDGQLTLPKNLMIIKVPCFRNKIFPITLNLLEQIQSISPDLIHLKGLWRQASFACYTWKQCNLMKPLIVQTAGMLEPWAINRNGLIKLVYYHIFEQKLLQICDYIHATSKREMLSLVEAHIAPKKIFLLEEGIDLPILKTPSTHEKSDFKTLLFLSRLHPVKGIELLIEAFSLLRPHRWKCKIVGMGLGNYQQHLEDTCRHLVVSDYIEFLGPLSGEEKQKAFMSADAFVLPSYSESFGIAIAEAMSYALPVITTTETPWQAIDDLSLGWRVRPDCNSLTRGLFELFSTERNTLREMGQRSRTFVANNYSWQVIALRLKIFYEKALRSLD